jgi:hypothetical protein
LEQQSRKLVFKGLADFDPQVPQLLLAGIAGGQYGYCNRAGHSLGYAVVGGTHTQEQSFRLEAEHFTSVAPLPTSWARPQRSSAVTGLC